MGGKTDPKIIDFVKRAKKKYKLEKALFFGSRARGDHFNTSDYDIIFVSHDFAGIFFTQRIARMYEFWKHYPLEIEPLCYTPEEFSKKAKEHGIIRTAIKEGKDLLTEI